MKSLSFSKITRSKHAHDLARFQLIDYSNEALRDAKRAIFALQRGDDAQSESLLKAAAAAIKNARLHLKNHPGLIAESSFRAAQEEYSEARIFQSYLQDKFSVSTDVVNDPDSLLGGLSDAAGEIARHAVLRATEHDRKSIEKAHSTVLKIVELLAELDLTGSLRSKFDQSKQHLRKIEDIRYDLSRKD